MEDCNWKRECVTKWDEEKAAFEALDRVEQDKRIAIHEKEVAADEAKQLAIKEAEEQLEKYVERGVTQFGRLLRTLLTLNSF